MFASLKKFLLAALVGLSLAVASQAVLAAEPTVDQVYQAAQAGRYIEAQAMLDEVIKAHPNSAKAQYIQAQVYAKQGFMNKAGDALAAADKLDPSGKYAKPEALQELRAKIAAPRANLSDNRALQSPAGGSVATIPQPQRQAPAPAPVPERRFPWGLLLGGLGLVAFIVWVTRMMAQRNAAAQAMQPVNNGGGMFGTPQQPYPGGAYSGGGGYPPGYGPGYGAPQAPGMGSRIMGGLATGAAVGAGIVAAEAIARQFTHDNGHANAATGGNADIGNNWGPSPSNYDMGGNDFGVADSSSWDSGGGGGGGDGGGSWD